MWRRDVLISAAEVEHGQLLDITTEIDVIWHVYENAAPNRDPPLLYAPRDNKPRFLGRRC